MSELEFQLTKVGLPNNCCVCGQEMTSAWYVRNEDEARSGQGRCPQDAGYSPEKATRKRGRPKKKSTPQ